MRTVEQYMKKVSLRYNKLLQQNCKNPDHTLYAEECATLELSYIDDQNEYAIRKNNYNLLMAIDILESKKQYNENCEARLLLAYKRNIIIQDRMFDYLTCGVDISEENLSRFSSYKPGLSDLLLRHKFFRTYPKMWMREIQKLK